MYLLKYNSYHIDRSLSETEYLTMNRMTDTFQFAQDFPSFSVLALKALIMGNPSFLCILRSP